MRYPRISSSPTNAIESNWPHQLLIISTLQKLSALNPACSSARFLRHEVITISVLYQRSPTVAHVCYRSAEKVRRIDPIENAYLFRTVIIFSLYTEKSIWSVDVKKVDRLSYESLFSSWWLLLLFQILLLSIILTHVIITCKEDVRLSISVWFFIIILLCFSSRPVPQLWLPSTFYLWLRVLSSYYRYQ